MIPGVGSCSPTKIAYEVVNSEDGVMFLQILIKFYLIRDIYVKEGGKKV